MTNNLLFSCQTEQLQLAKGVVIGVGGLLVAQKIYQITQLPHQMNRRAMVARIDAIQRVSATHIAGLTTNQPIPEPMRNALADLLTESTDTIRTISGIPPERAVAHFRSVQEITDFRQQLPPSWPGWVTIISYKMGALFRSVTTSFGYGMVRGR